MVDHPFIQNASDIPGMTGSNFLNDLLNRTIMVLKSSEDLVDFDFSTGVQPLVISSISNRADYYYDSSDTTTTASIDCLVSGDGRRYKGPIASAISTTSVLAMQNTPPVSPSINDVYIVDTAPTGAWVGQEKRFAIFTPLGWRHALPYLGANVLNQATGANIQYNTSGVWTDPPFSVSDTSIRLYKLFHAAGLVVEAIQNTPPGSPAADVYYIVDNSPTGDWVGNTDKIAYYLNATWQFIDAYEGAIAYDKGSSALYTYSGSAWGTSETAVISSVITRTSVNRTISFTGVDTSEVGDFTYQGDSSKKMRIIFEPVTGASLSYVRAAAVGNDYELYFSLFRDSETIPIKIFMNASGNNGDDASIMGLSIISNPSVIGLTPNSNSTDFGTIDIADSSSHTYYFRVKCTKPNSINNARFHGTFLVEEWTQ